MHVDMTLTLGLVNQKWRMLHTSYLCISPVLVAFYAMTWVHYDPGAITIQTQWLCTYLALCGQVQHLQSKYTQLETQNHDMQSLTWHTVDSLIFANCLICVKLNDCEHQMYLICKLKWSKLLLTFFSKSKQSEKYTIQSIDSPVSSLLAFSVAQDNQVEPPAMKKESINRTLSTNCKKIKNKIKSRKVEKSLKYSFRLITKYSCS